MGKSTKHIPILVIDRFGKALLYKNISVMMRVLKLGDRARVQKCVQTGEYYSEFIASKRICFDYPVFGWEYDVAEVEE